MNHQKPELMRGDITKRQMTKIAREVSKFTVRNLRREGIGAGEFDVIHAVRHNPGITQAGVCRILGTDKAAVARQSASLEAKGYLERRANSEDGRSRRLYPTSLAENLRDSKVRIESLFYSWLLEGLESGERAEFARMLEKLYQRSRAESRADFAEVTKRVEEDK